MSTTPDLDAIALEVKAAQDTSRQLERITSRFDGFDMASAYAVARRIHRQRVDQGARPIGRKIGLTNPDLWPQLAAGAPMWSYMYDTTVMPLTGGERTFSLRGATEPRIEPEIVVHFHAAPPAGGSLEEMTACIDWIAPAFEIVQSHFPGWVFHAADAVADSAFHYGLLLGEKVEINRLPSDIDSLLKHLSVELVCDGTVADVGRGANVLGGPLTSIQALVRLLSAQSEDASIQADEMISTGSLTKAFPVAAGQTWEARFQGIALATMCVGFVD